MVEGVEETISSVVKGLATLRPEKNLDLAEENFVHGWTHLVGANLREFVEKK